MRLICSAVRFTAVRTAEGLEREYPQKGFSDDTSFVYRTEGAAVPRVISVITHYEHLVFGDGKREMNARGDGVARKLYIRLVKHLSVDCDGVCRGVKVNRLSRDRDYSFYKRLGVKSPCFGS